MQSKKRILFPFCGDTIGGSHISSVSLINKLSEKYDVITLINSDKKIKDFFEFHKIKPKIFKYTSYEPGYNSFKYFFLFPIFFYNIFKIYINYKPSLIHINDIRTLITWLPFYLINKKKIIYHNRNPLPKNKILFFLIKNSNIITISKFLREELPREWNVKLIYNPIFISSNKNIPIMRENKRLIIGYFSNFSPKKKPDLFVRIAKKISQFYSSEFLMMGRYSREEYNKINNLIISNGLKNILKIYDFQIDHYDVMAKCDYIISCSINESFGRIPLEASLLKVPVIASNSGGHKETIINNVTGILVEPKNEISYLKAVNNLEEDKKLKTKIIDNAYRRTKEEFSKENHYKSILEYYEKNCFYN